MRNLLIGAIFVAGAVCATLLLVNRDGRLAQSRASQDAEEKIESSRTQTTRPAAPIQNGGSLPVTTAAGLPDPTHGPKGGLPEGKRGADAANVLYRNFVSRAQLSDAQSKAFQQTIADIREMQLARGKRDSKAILEHAIAADKAKARGQEPPVAPSIKDTEGADLVDHEAYERVKKILTPEQYHVFSDEIGWQFPFVIAFIDTAQ
jgi:hypothetical protein